MSLLYFSGDSTMMFGAAGIGVVGNWTLDLKPSLHCRINWTSLEYSPHFVKICNGLSLGASCLSLFLQRSIKVNRPDFPVA